jgi:thiol-disulfide isomerase/thioredoxin
MKKLAFPIQVIIAALFIVSAIAKMYPSPYFAISTFEVKQLYPLGFSETIAPWFSRTLIGIEMALGLLILQNNFLKKIIIPATMLLLAVFVGHLSYVTFLSGGNSGNCGCFGELIPMTPIEAIIKNIVAIGLLGWLYTLVTEKTNSKLWVLPAVTLATIVAIFILAPIKKITNDFMVTPGTSTEVVSDSLMTKENTVAEIPVTTEIKKDSVKKEDPKKVEKTTVIPTDQPTAKKSGYAKFFSKIDNGRKTLCFFVPGCDHCRQAAKELTELKKNNKDFPEISILFMNEEADLIPAFFKEAGAQYPYKIIEIIPFWNLLGTGKDTPGVKYLWNGNEYKYYYGITDNKFNPDDYQTLINKPFLELK